MERKFSSGNIVRFFVGSSVSKTIPAVTILLCCALFATRASGSSCGGQANRASAVALPQMRAFEPMSSAHVAAKNTHESDNSIVGLWHILFLLPTGEVFDEGFDQFYSDGLEILNDNPSPGAPNGSGDVCLGVFKKTAPETYQLKHPFWNYDEKGILIGKGVDLVTIIVDDDASFHGSFTFITYDLKGVETSRLEGNVEAERITPD